MIAEPLQQQSQIFDMPSGARLAVTVAPFVDAWSLMKATLKTLKGFNLKPEDLKLDMTSLLKSTSGISMMLDRIVDFATAPDVEVAIWKCAQRSLYIPADSPIEFPGHPVNMKLLDDPSCGMAARGDYSKIVMALLEVNCAPFLANLLSGSKKQTERNLQDQTSR